ncbi:MAG: methylenetetrahydromethanopterin dehydrogenase, partial [Gammaproteobacteria bacterium]|nr:methylenetetrahydromethanopterin dehydrogenase [Gammaproteobacteria bacterium]
AAAALMACVEHWVEQKRGVSLRGLNIYFFGGTGPVGLCAGVIAAECGANVFLGSRRSAEHARAIAEPFNKRYGIHMDGTDGRLEDALVLPHRGEHMLGQSHVVINTAKAGVQVVSISDLKMAKELIVAADCNAVPPLGIEGVDVNDTGKVLEATPSKAVGIGALAIGNVKYKVHSKLCQMMLKTEKPLYLDFHDAFKVAREYARGT